MIFKFLGGVIETVRNLNFVFILLFGLSFSVAGHSQQIFNPIQSPYSNAILENQSFTTEPEWTSQLKEKFFNVRVKIFPHNSKYNAPQGRDINIGQLSISSNGDCNIYKSEFPTSENEITRNFLLKTGKKFDFSSATLIDPIWIECTQPFEVKRPDFPNSPITYSGLLFLKSVKASPAFLTAVNVLPFEQYLKGVVPSEMPASWSAEALKAQAIAARTYAYFELGTEVSSIDPNMSSEQSGAQIDDTVTYQAYLGLKNNTVATDTAIDQTTGQVMTYKNKVIKAYFSADSGGHTESSENVWGDIRPYVIAKPEIYPDGSVPGTTWSFTATFTDLSAKLVAAEFLSEGEILESLSIDPHDLYPSTRPKNVELKLTSGKSKRISAVDYSFATKIKSAWISFSKGNDLKTITISGRGFGHGAGMSQWGAKAMVDKLKMTHKQILEFYYTDIQIVN